MRLDVVAESLNASELVHCVLIFVAVERVELTVGNLAAAQGSAVDGEQPILRRLETTTFESLLNVVPT